METDKTILETAYKAGPDKYIYALTDCYITAIGGTLTDSTMNLLNTDQHTLLAYRYLLDEVCEGGFIQLIENGYGPYVLAGPFPMIIKKEWGFVEFGKFLYEVRKEYLRNKDALEQDYTDEEFMALYEEYDKLNNLGDEFLDDWEELMTPSIAEYVHENLSRFI